MENISTYKSPLRMIWAESGLRQAGYMMNGHHCHEHYELFHVESGSCRFLIEASIYDLHPGDLILIPPMKLHYTRYPFGDCRRNILFFRREDVERDIVRQMPGCCSFFSDTRILQVPESHQAEISSHIARMVREEKIGDRRSSSLLRLQLQELLLMCNRFCEGDFLENAPARIITTDKPILEAARFIAAHYMDDISTSDIAKAAGFSPNYFTRKFREATGIGVHDYLVFIRLQHAALELVSTTDSVTDIALRCGFSDGNYFKDAFKKKYGVTPRAYRKRTSPEETANVGT